MPSRVDTNVPLRLVDADADVQAGQATVLFQRDDIKRLALRAYSLHPR